MEVVLVRHAATTWSGRRYCGRSDPWLSAAGRAEAIALAREVAAVAVPPVHIVSSPRRRARQTARAIAAALGVAPITIDPRWAETDFGRMEGRTFAEVERHDPGLAAQLAAGEIPTDWPDGETAEALATRVGAAVAAIADRADGPGTLVVVSHAGPLRLAIAWAEDRDPRSVALAGTGSVHRMARVGQRARLRA